MLVYGLRVVNESILMKGWAVMKTKSGTSMAASIPRSMVDGMVVGLYKVVASRNLQIALFCLCSF